MLPGTGATGVTAKSMEWSPGRATVVGTQGVVVGKARMSKALIVAAALSRAALLGVAVLGLAMPAMARNAQEPEKSVSFQVCSGCKTIFDRNYHFHSEPNANDLASVDSALKKELGVAAVNAASFGRILMGPGNRVQSVTLSGRQMMMLATVTRQEDGTYAVTRGNAVESVVSGWAQRVTTDALHGSRQVLLSVLAEEEGAGSLVVRCVGDKLDVLALWRNDIGPASDQAVQWRIDDKPVVSETWPYNANGLMASPRPVPLLEDLLKARRFVIRVRTRGGLERTMVFAVAGMDEFLGSLRQACSW